MIHWPLKIVWKIVANILVLFPLFCCSQKQGNIWYFGNQAGLDFNSGSPVALTNGAIYDGPDQSEGTSVISDSSGALLFYTNGQKIWNRNHQIMPNGNGLFGNYSSTQAALIVPQPGSNRYFYVFTTDAFQDTLRNGLRYSVVDICLDGGLGDVVRNKKNIKLVDTVAEKLTAVRHSNGLDYWIIAHKYLSDAFYALQLNISGITNTVITHIGSIHQGYCGNPSSCINAMGSMKASPNGNKLAIVSAQQCNNISELFDFNKTTGLLSNLVKLRTDSLAVGLYGVSFSPDNSKLYITSWMNNDRIYQYDLSSGNQGVILASKTIIASHNGGPWYMAMQLGPDGKIYIAERGQTYMGRINNPNLAGLSCNYQDTAVSLSGKLNVLGLPNFIDFFDYSNTTSPCSSPTEVQEQNYSSQVSIFPNPFNDIIKINYAHLSATLELNIFSVFGQRIYSALVNSNESINLGNFSSGIYFYFLTELTKDRVITTGKIIKE